MGPFSRLEFPNGMSCSIYVSRSLYQFQVHRRAPRRTGVYDQMEQLFTNRKCHFCSYRNFRFFFLNGKRPRTWSFPKLQLQRKQKNSLFITFFGVSSMHSYGINIPLKKREIIRRCRFSCITARYWLIVTQ